MRRERRIPKTHRRVIRALRREERAPGAAEARDAVAFRRVCRLAALHDADADFCRRKVRALVTAYPKAILVKVQDQAGAWWTPWRGLLCIGSCDEPMPSKEQTGQVVRAPNGRPPRMSVDDVQPGAAQ